MQGYGPAAAAAAGIDPSSIPPAAFVNNQYQMMHHDHAGAAADVKLASAAVAMGMNKHDGSYTSLEEKCDAVAMEELEAEQRLLRREVSQDARPKEGETSDNEKSVTPRPSRSPDPTADESTKVTVADTDVGTDSKEQLKPHGAVDNVTEENSSTPKPTTSNYSNPYQRR